MKKSITILIIVVMIVAIVTVANTAIRAAVYVADTGVVDVTSPDFVPNNLGKVVIVKGVKPPSASSSDVTVLARVVSSVGEPLVANVIPKPVAKPPDEYPAKLIVPALGVNAVVQTVGLTARGSIGTPNNFTDVAWYVFGPVPGRQGTAIFDGHVDNGLGLSGVFKNLSTLKIGDDVEVVTNGGISMHYTVSNVSSFDYKNVPPETMFSASGPSQIVLVSCEGTWVGADRTYDRRLIVTAVYSK